MTEEEILLDEAEHIVKILPTEGFKNILSWIGKRVEKLQKRIDTGETDISVENVTKSKSKKIEITIVNINKDYERHELQVWRLFKRKISDWEETVSEARRK